MNSKQLQYAVLLSEIRNFSLVAEHLNISQPALSKQISGLEQELGLRLFDRSTTPLSLTPAGKHFIQSARELLYREDQLKRSMEDFKSGQRGTLTIGISPFRSLYLIAPVAKKIREKFPGIEIVLHEAGSDQLRKDAAEGKLDFAIVNLPVDDSILDVTPIEPDKLILAVPKPMLGRISPLPSSPLPRLDLKECRELPFIAVGQSQEMRRLFDKLCTAADLEPEIAMEVVGVTTAWAMARAGIGATLLPLQFAESMSTDDALSYFTLENSTQSRQPAVITRRGQYLSEYAKYAINLLIQT